MSKFIDLTGKQFGRLVVIHRICNNKRENIQWLCNCDCGKEKIIAGTSLKSGVTKSCGCLQKEITIKRLTKHSHTKNGQTSKTYSTWIDMIQRCTNPNSKDYHNYGGRGITVCKKWMKFENFLKDMGESPEKHQIDRADNNKGYCKLNCRWATRKEQQRNTRANHMITFGGKTQCLAAWAEELKISYQTLHARLRRKWSIEKALTTPARKVGVS